MREKIIKADEAIEYVVRHDIDEVCKRTGITYERVQDILRKTRLLNPIIVALRTDRTQIRSAENLDESMRQELEELKKNMRINRLTLMVPADFMVIASFDLIFQFPQPIEFVDSVVAAIGSLASIVYDYSYTIEAED